MYRHEPAFCAPPSDADTPLWRVMDLAKFESFVTRSALYFRRADLFEDPQEGTLPPANEAVGNFFGFRFDPNTPKGREFVAHKKAAWLSIRRWNYVNCWFNGQAPSDEMWNRFGAGGTGVAIRSSFARLVLALYATRRDVYISKVEYLDGHEEPVGERSLNSALVRKVRKYAEEREVRAIVSLLPQSGPSIADYPDADHVSIPVTLGHLVSQIHVGPRSSPEQQMQVHLLLPWMRSLIGGRSHEEL